MKIDKHFIPTTNFTKQHTKIAKGIAILFMVYHHLFVIPEQLNNAYIAVPNLFGYDIQLKIAVFCKICVAIYCFLSGLGIYHSLKNTTSLLEMYKKVGKKIVSFMINYWIILLIVFPIGVYLGFFQFDLKTLLQAIVGINDSVMEWWFIRQYIIQLLIVPAFIYFINQKRIRYKPIPLIVLGLLLIAIKLFLKVIYNMNGGYGIVTKVLFYYSDCVLNKNCVLAFFIGLLCAHFNIYKYFVLKNRALKYIFNSFVLAFSVVLRVLVNKQPASMTLDFIIAPLFVFSITTIIYETKFIKKILAFFAGHSTNIWLTHTFWYLYFAKPIVLLPKYSTLIYLWLIVLSLASSYVIKGIYCIPKIPKKLNNKI